MAWLSFVYFVFLFSGFRDAAASLASRSTKSHEKERKANCTKKYLISLDLRNASTQTLVRYLYNLEHFPKDAAERLAQVSRNAGVDLHGNRDLLLGKIHHVGHIAGEETAVAV